MKRIFSGVILLIYSTLLLSNKTYSEENFASINIKKIIGANSHDFHKNPDTLNKNIDVLNQKLNLSEEQTQKELEIADFAFQKLHIYDVEYTKAKKNLILMIKNNASKQDIEKQTNLVQSLKTRMKVTRNKSIKKFEEILNDEQKTEFSKFMSELKEEEAKN